MSPAREGYGSEASEYSGDTADYTVTEKESADDADSSPETDESADGVDPNDGLRPFDESDTYTEGDHKLEATDDIENWALAWRCKRCELVYPTTAYFAACSCTKSACEKVDEDDG